MPKYITTVARVYNNRRLMAGDELTGISRRDGDLMVRLGRASLVPDALAPSSFKVPPPPKPAAPVVVETPAPAAVVTPESKAAGDEPGPSTLDTVRAEYERVVGKRWYHAWDEAELRKRIADHQSGSTDES